MRNFRVIINLALSRRRMINIQRLENDILFSLIYLS